MPFVYPQLNLNRGTIPIFGFCASVDFPSIYLRSIQPSLRIYDAILFPDRLTSAGPDHRQRAEQLPIQRTRVAKLYLVTVSSHGSSPVVHQRSSGIPFHLI